MILVRSSKDEYTDDGLIQVCDFPYGVGLSWLGLARLWFFTKDCDGAPGLAVEACGVKTGFEVADFDVCVLGEAVFELGVWNYGVFDLQQLEKINDIVNTQQRKIIIWKTANLFNISIPSIHEL